MSRIDAARQLSKVSLPHRSDARRPPLPGYPGDLKISICDTTAKDDDLPSLAQDDRKIRIAAVWAAILFAGQEEGTKD